MSDLTVFPPSQVNLIKAQIMNGESCTDDDLALFGAVCKQTGLNPFCGQIYAVQRKGKWTYQISVHGFRSIADQTGLLAGIDEATYNDGKNLFEMLAKKLPIVTATVTVWKMVGGQRVPFTATVAYDQYVQIKQSTGKPNEVWGKMPHVMLAKCAEVAALRKGFPMQLGGQYAPEESGAFEREVPIEVVSAKAFASAPDNFTVVKQLAETLGLSTEDIKNIMSEEFDGRKVSTLSREELDTLLSIMKAVASLNAPVEVLPPE